MTRYAQSLLIRLFIRDLRNWIQKQSPTMCIYTVANLRHISSSQHKPKFKTKKNLST